MCTIYLSAVLCFVPPNCCRWRSFLLFKELFFLLLKEPKWVHKFLSRPWPIPHRQQPLARAFFTQWRGFFSSSVFRFLLLRSPSIIAVHRVRRFFPSHPIAVERNVSAHNTIKTYEALSVNVRAFFPPSAACSHSPSYRPRRRYERRMLGKSILFFAMRARVFVSFFFSTEYFHSMRTNFPQQFSTAAQRKKKFGWLTESSLPLFPRVVPERMFEGFEKNTHSTYRHTKGWGRVCELMGVRIFHAQKFSARDEMMIWRDIQYFFHIIFLSYTFFSCVEPVSHLLSNWTCFVGLLSESGWKRKTNFPRFFFVCAFLSLVFIVVPLNVPEFSSCRFFFSVSVLKSSDSPLWTESERGGGGRRKKMLLWNFRVSSLVWAERTSLNDILDVLLALSVI